MAPFASGTARLWTSISSILQKHPVTFNSITGGALCGGSDLLAQYLEHQVSPSQEENMPLDMRRAAAAGLIGSFFGGGVYPFAYAKLDAIWKGTNFSSVLQKSIVEIFTVGIFVNTISMTSRGLLVGRDAKSVANHVKTEMPTVTLNDVKVWLPYNLVAFTFIPAYIRPSTTALMEATWQTYISLRSNDYATANTKSLPAAVAI